MTAETTVIISTYNRKHCVMQAIDSAKAGGDNVEIIVVDNGSTDGTEEFCRNLESIKCLSLQENAGPSAARNAGIAAAKGKYLAFLDDDDVLLPGALDRLQKVLESSPAAALSYGQIYLGDQNGVATSDKFPARQYKGDVFWQLIQSNFIMVHSALVRRECVEKVGAFNIDLWHNEDWDLWVRIAERWPIAALAQPVGIVRLNSPDQISHRRVAMYRAALALRRKWMTLPRAEELAPSAKAKLERDLRRASAGHLMNEAIDQIKAGHPLRFGRFAAGAIGINTGVAMGHLLRRSANLFRSEGTVPA